MRIVKSIASDIAAINQYTCLGWFKIVFFNRGFHALVSYRIAHSISHLRVPIIPNILTRIVQIFYAIDIDYRCKIDPGVVIMHGVGLVIGKGAIIHRGVILFHQVTVGRRQFGDPIPIGDGFPSIGKNVILGAGAKLLGLFVLVRIP